MCFNNVWRKKILPEGSGSMRKEQRMSGEQEVARHGAPDVPAVKPCPFFIPASTVAGGEGSVQYITLRM